MCVGVGGGGARLIFQWEQGEILGNMQTGGKRKNPWEEGKNIQEQA